MLDEQTVYAHLKDLYGVVPEHNDLLLKHLITSTVTLIQNFCHRTDIPAGAVHPAIDYICGRYLLHKIQTGTLVDKEGNPLFEFYAPEASVSIGDVSVSYESGYGSIAGNNGLLGQLNEMASEKNLKLALVHFRKVKWK